LVLSACAPQTIDTNLKVPSHDADKERVVEKIIATGLKPVVLFDFDSTGNEREKRLIELLLATGLVPDTVLRRKFQQVFGLRFFEDIGTKYEEIRKKIEENRKR